MRRNERGLDLNRRWRAAKESEILAVRRAIRGRSFELAYLMHEDYDATGFYLYELAPHHDAYGGRVLEAAGRLIPIERRALIEGRRVSVPGLICRDRAYRYHRRKLWPEAFCLIDRHARHLFNAETPSTGFSLALRMKAQIAGLRAAVCGLERRHD